MDFIRFTQIVGAVIVVGLLIGVSVWFGRGFLSDISWPGADRRAAREATERGEILTQSGSEMLADRQAEDVEDVIESFAKHYQHAVGEADEEAARAAQALLSERGRTVVDQDKSPVTGLQRFTRNLAVPDEVRILISKKQSDTFAEADTEWVYPDETLPRYFYFRIENGEWKIDSLQTVKQ